MPRSKANYDRESDNIIPPFAYIVATEGETEQDYFNKFINNYPNKLIELVFVPKEGKSKNESSPKQVFGYLSAFDKEYNIRKDQNKKLWQLADRDRWRKHIVDAYKNCIKNKYNFILSNPCFELWLFLHYKSINELSEKERVDIYENKKGKNKKGSKKRNYLDKELVNICGSYNKSNINFEHYKDKIQTAINNAKKIKDYSIPYPNDRLGTDVFILVEELLSMK